MSEERASVEKIQRFLNDLKDINISVRRFCEIAAAEEYNLTEVEIKKLAEAYRKRFSRKSMALFEFNVMLDILEKQPEFKSSNKIRLSRKKNIFRDLEFEKSLRSSFDFLQ